MNLKKLGRMSGMVAAVAMLAMVLQGCGGDDNGSNVSQDMYDSLKADYDKAVADRDAAMSAQATAEAAATTAMAAQAEAEEAEADAKAAQMAAETAKDTAVAAQAVAEAARMAAETAKMEADAAAKEAMAAEEKAKTDLATANTDKAVAEAAAMAAKEAQAKAEAAQKVAEDAQEMAEEAEKTAKAAEMAANAAKMTAETERDEANTAKMEAEAAAKTAKEAQEKAESDLATAKADLKKAEDERDEALAALKKDQDADDAQRARVDAAAIQMSAGTRALVRPGIDWNQDGDYTDNNGGLDQTQENTAVGDLNNDGDTNDNLTDQVPIYGSSTNTVANYQGSQTRPFVNLSGGADNVNTDGETDDTTGDDGGFESLRLRATHAGAMVRLTAQAGVGDNVKTYFDVSTQAGADGMTSATEEMESGGHTKHLYLMTDIEPSVSSPFGLTATTSPEGLGDGTLHPESQKYRFAMTDLAANDDSVVLVHTPAINITLGAFAPTDAVPTQSVQADAQLAGSYAGVAGVYRCAVTGDNAACNFDRNDEDQVQMNGIWQFIPDALARSAADPDYLLYGAWLGKPDSAVGTGYSAGLASGNALFDSNGTTDGNGIGGLVGTAKYKGSAAGFFAERHVGVGTAESGTFTATAELTANFDADADSNGTADSSAISGMIKDFMRSDEVAVDWTVELRAVTVTDIVDNAATTGVAGGFRSGNTAGSASGVSWTGEWGVQYFGNATAAGQHPSSVAGTFGAQRGSPALLTDEPGTGETVADQGFVGVIGGFGARKQ